MVTSMLSSTFKQLDHLILYYKCVALSMPRFIIVFKRYKLCNFRYQKFDLGDDMHLIVRCEHDAVMVGANGEKSFVNIKTLNEWNPYVSA